MRSLFLSAAALSGVLYGGPVVRAAEFADQAPANEYTQGTIISGFAVYNDLTAPTGEPARLISPGHFPGLLSPYNPPFETNEIVAIGLGGTITLHMAHPTGVAGGPQIGVFSNVGLSAANFSTGKIGDPATTFSLGEFGAERSAVVEVAQIDGQFHSLGRVVFNKPSTGYTNITSTSQLDTTGLIESDFTKPFTSPLSDFSGDSLSEVMAEFDGSGGGNWIDVPANIGISQINFIRFSDPMWAVPDGNGAYTYVTGRHDRFGGKDDPDRPADFLIDSVVAVPEPATIGLLILAVVPALRRRGR
jgi:hypothetical protein